MSASLDFAAPKLGSGTRFKKLSGALASRGAKDPDALAAFIGRKNYGAKSMGRLSAGKSLANPDLGIYLAGDDDTLTCPSCGHKGLSGEFSGDSDDDGDEDNGSPSKGTLRTPAPGTGFVRDGVPLTVRGGKPAHALSNTRGAVELATGITRRPIHGPMDVLVKRAEDGTALLKHRQGGATIAALRQTPEGKWVATVNGKDGAPRDHQRTALMEAVGTWNTAVRGGVRTQEAPLQPEPRQTPLMEQYGIPAMRSAGFATATVGAGDGARVTSADAGSGGDDGTDDNGLTAKGKAIYAKLIKKGFPAARALAFAKNSQKAKAGQFGKAG